MTTLAPRTHVLLIGIDAYKGSPLRGCVNDINLIERLLIERLGLPEADIRRLASPHPDRPPRDKVGDIPATLTNICAALEDLAGERVKDRDRVFIYYSGHGARVITGALGDRISREALVPIDVYRDTSDSGQFLFDFQLNAHLGAISRRTSHVTLILDCCHSAGAFRGDDADEGSGDVRRLPVGRDRVVVLPPAQFEVLAQAGSRGIGSDPGLTGRCTVIAACQTDERAKELPLGAQQGKHGVFTWSLVSRLNGVAPDELPNLTWGHIWRPLVSATAELNPNQTPLLTSGWHRPVFGGASREGDVGVGIATRTDGRYDLNVGSLAGALPGAQLAVYGAEPLQFPPLGSEADRASRVGVVRVVSSAPASAVAAARESPGFALPMGARGRFVEFPAEGRLRVDAEGIDQAIRDEIGRSAVLQTASGAEDAEIILRMQASQVVICDDLNGVGDRPPLVSVPPTPMLIRELLEHCGRHRAPLWFARRCADLPNALSIRVLDCSDPQTFRSAIAADGQNPALPEAAAHERYTYRLKDRQRCCFRVENNSGFELAVTLLNCGSSGRVEHIGFERVPAEGRHVFWDGSTIGEPFEAAVCDGRVDRIIAIASTRANNPWTNLTVNESFADVIQSYEANRGTRSGDGDDRPFRSRNTPPPPPESWTARSITVLIEQN